MKFNMILFVFGVSLSFRSSVCGICSGKVRESPVLLACDHHIVRPCFPHRVAAL